MQYAYTSYSMWDERWSSNKRPYACGLFLAPFLTKDFCLEF